MFNVSKFCRKSIRLLHQKLWYELIGPCMYFFKHKHNLCLEASRETIVKFTSRHFVYNECLGTKFFHANVQCVCIVRPKYQIVSLTAVVRADWPVYALFKHKHNPYLKASWKINCYVHKAAILSIIIILAPNVFMQMFNVSLLCRQSIKLFQQKLWYELIGMHMYYLCINKIH